MQKSLIRASLLAYTAAFALAGSAALAQERPLRLDEAAVGELDPAKGVDYADTVLAINLYEPLVFPAQGAAGVQPWLASSWVIDGLNYTFTIREGAKFASGNPVTAQDVIYSYERLMALGQGRSSLFEGRVASVSANDDGTVTFTLTADFAPFLASLVQLSVIDSAVAKEHQAAGDFGDLGDYSAAWLSAQSAGSGAYVVSSHDPQVETVMVPNPNFSGGAVDPLAPDQVTYRYSLEASTVRALMARGEHDISSLWLPPEVLKAMAEEGTVHLAAEPGGTGEYIMLNTVRAPLDDVHCRQALTWAYDYATTLQLLAITDEVSQGAALNSPMPKSLYGHEVDRPDLVQDLEKAKEELALCKYDPAQYPLDIAWIAEVPARERLALLMQATFSQLGFQVNVVRTPWALVTEQVTKPDTAPHAIEIAVSTITPDTDSLAYNMFSSTVPHTWQSATYLADAEVDGYLEAGRKEIDPEKRAQIYRDMANRIRDLAPAIFAYEFNGIYGVRNGVEVPNLEEPGKLYPLSGFSMLFKDIRVKG